MKRVAILGSTGSIGTQTLGVIRFRNDVLKVVALAAYSNESLLAEQAAEFGAATTALFKRDGMSALVDMVTASDVDVVVVSVAGMIGLEPTLAALKAGKRVALASKEVLVAGGAVVMPLVKSPEMLRPIDSEHSAVLQCLQGENLSQIEQLILTASGGPFRGWSKSQLEGVTPEQALNHPTWKMGGKITIDSATMMNKGLELIEACWLFGVSPDQVDVVVHPQSVIHSMVKFADGSVIAQMGHPDMKLPIQYALLGPDRQSSPAKSWDPSHSPNLTFEKLDASVFPCPDYAREAFRMGGVAPAYLNAVNEMAANAFLNGEIGFMDIVRAAERSLLHAPKAEASLANVLEADQSARANWKRELATS